MRLGEIKRSAASEEGIDIGPLIDIIFILLIFFMVSSTFVRHLELPLKRPSARSSQASSPKALRVVIDRQGRWFFENQALQPWMLQDRIRQALAIQADRSVLITVDVQTEAKHLIEAVDQARLAGAKHVAAETEDPR